MAFIGENQLWLSKILHGKEFLDYTLNMKNHEKSGLKASTNRFLKAAAIFNVVAIPLQVGFWTDKLLDLGILDSLTGKFPVEYVGKSSRQVFGHDDRVQISPAEKASKYGWISRVNVPKGRCTSFFLEPPYPIPEDTVLSVTAAHCVSEDGGDLEISYDTEGGGQFWAQARLWVHPGYKNDPDKNDIAFLLQEKPAPETGIKIETAQYADFGKDLPSKVDAFGYAFDKPGLSAHFGCSTAKMSDGVIQSFCDSASGQSGGPVTLPLTQGERPQVIAVTSGVTSYYSEEIPLNNSLLSDKAKFEAWVDQFQRDRGQMPSGYDI